MKCSVLNSVYLISLAGRISKNLFKKLKKYFNDDDVSTEICKLFTVVIRRFFLGKYVFFGNHRVTKWAVRST